MDFQESRVGEEVWLDPHFRRLHGGPGKAGITSLSDDDWIRAFVVGSKRVGKGGEDSIVILRLPNHNNLATWAFPEALHRRTEQNQDHLG